MKKMFLSVILTVFGLLISCSDENEQKVLNETVNAEDFYLSKKSEIQKMDRHDLAGLNIYLQQYAYKDFSNSKKKKLWMEKLEEAKKINSLESEQKQAINQIISKISDFRFELKSQESEELIQFIKEEIEKSNFDYALSQKIFTTLAPIDKDGNVLNYNYENIIATKESLKELNIAPESTARITSSNCNTGACFWCSPAYDDCTGTCVESDGVGCGLLLLEQCDNLCYNGDVEVQNPHLSDL